MSDETIRAVEEYRARAALRQSAGEMGINPVAVFEDVMFYADVARKTVAGEPWAPAWWQNKPAEVDRFSLDGAGAAGKVVLRVNPDGDTRWFDAFVARLPEVGYDMLRVAVDRARAEGATAAGNRNV